MKIKVKDLWLAGLGCTSEGHGSRSRTERRVAIKVKDVRLGARAWA